MMLKQIKRWLPWCWLIFCFLALMLFLHRILPNMLEADMATEMVLAKHTADTGNWLHRDWYYGSEIRALSMPQFFAPFFLFTDNWHLVRLLGTASGFICLLASFYYLCRQLHVEKWFPITASTLLMPVSKIYSYIIHIGAYYLTYGSISFLTLGMLIHYQKTSVKRTRIILGIALGVLAFLSGMMSLRLLLLLYIPAFLVSLFLYFRPWGNCENRLCQLLSSSLFTLFAAIAGYLFNIKILSREYYFQQYGEAIHFTGVNFDEIAVIFNEWLELLGYQNSGSLFSSALFHAAACLMLVGLIVLAVRAAVSKNAATALSWEGSLPVLVHVCGLLLLTGLVSASTTPYSLNYLVPSLILTPITIAAFLSRCRWRPVIRRILAAATVLLVLLCSADTARNYAQLRLNDELQQFTASLADDGYTDGYSTFWRGNLITELSDGRIDMRVWKEAEDMDVASVNPVLQLKTHETTVPQGKTCIIFSKWYNEHTNRRLAQWLQPEDIYWDSQDWLVYGYDSYDDLLNSVEQQYTAYYANGSWTAAVPSEDADRLLASGSSTTLPAMPLYPGTYSVTLTGAGLDALDIACTHENGELDILNPQFSSGTLTFQLEASELLHTVCIALVNGLEEAVAPRQFLLEKISGL